MSNKAEKRGLVPRLRFPEFREAGGWGEKRLEDFAIIVRGGSPRPIDEYITSDTHGLNWLKIGDIDKESKFVTSTQEKVIPAALSKTRVVNPGDLILSNSMSFGRPYILEIETCIHDGWIAVSEINKSLDRDYLYYLMMTSASQTYFSNNAAGSGVQNLNADIIKHLPVSYPNKKEQQKIADCLASLDELITLEAQKLDTLKTHKKGLMQQLFPAEDETLPKLRFPELREAGKWEEATLGAIAKITSGGTPNRAEPNYWGGSIPWVTTSLIDFNRIDETEEFITTEGLKNSSAKLFPVKTLLMAMYGQGKTRGKVALLSIEAATNQACAAIMLNKEVDTNFVFYNLASRYDEIRKLSNEGGQENLSAGLIKNISVIIPSLPEQQKIADCLVSLDDLITAQALKLAALKTHKKGLMQQLFPALGDE